MKLMHPHAVSKKKTMENVLEDKQNYETSMNQGLIKITEKQKLTTKIWQ